MYIYGHILTYVIYMVFLRAQCIVVTPNEVKNEHKQFCCYKSHDNLNCAKFFLCVER